MHKHCLCLANYDVCVQRGTGLSTPLTTTALAQFESPKQQAAYLRNFRADSIVKDAEIVRSYLVPDGEPWSVLGQVNHLTCHSNLFLGFLFADFLCSRPVTYSSMLAISVHDFGYLPCLIQ